MRLVNGSALVAGFTTSTDKAGREWLVVAAKGTWRMPDADGAVPRPDAQPLPLILADTFAGLPGLSAPLVETDFAPRKPRCDVLLHGHCHAPDGRPATRVAVGLRVGPLVKTFNVVGDRHWRNGLLHASATDPQPFTMMPISYANAYGGVDQAPTKFGERRWYPENHAGVGFHPLATRASLDGRRLPNTEAIDAPVTSPTGDYRPMAFGPVGRAWQPRVALAGTYDEAWQQARAPFLPEDFDERYFQSAPEDQQMPYPVGGEEVVLVNLTPSGRRSFRLPPLRQSVEYFYRDGNWRKASVVVDTLVLEPSAGRFSMTARAGLPLRRSLHEIECVVLGEMPEDWYRAEGLRRAPRGKRHYASLGDLVDSQRP